MPARNKGTLFTDAEIAIFKQFIKDRYELNKSEIVLSADQKTRLNKWRKTRQGKEFRNLLRISLGRPPLAGFEKNTTSDSPSTCTASSSVMVENKKSKRRRRSAPARQQKRRVINKNRVVNQESEPEEECVFPLQLNPDDLVFLQTPPLGEGQNGKVGLAKYGGILVACKYRRPTKTRRAFDAQTTRELKFAARLSVCRFVNTYIGVVRYKGQRLRQTQALPLQDQKPAVNNNNNHHQQQTKKPAYAKSPDLYIVQRYYANGDLRSFMEKKMGMFHPLEVCQIGISLFAALTDAHKLDIGIVDLKLENILVDETGSSWITDFGSCIDMGGRAEVSLNKEGVSWTKDVAAPEMIRRGMFCKASDVFMATVILAEMMTPEEYTDKEFQERVLVRDGQDGSVQFSSLDLCNSFSKFFILLQRGLENDPNKRPSASDVLCYLEAMRRDSFAAAVKELN